MDGQAKLQSRLSSLNLFNKFSQGQKPPPLPPKDAWYLQASASTLSLAPSSYVPPSSSLVASNTGRSFEALRVSTDNMGCLPNSSQQDISRSRSPTPSTGTMTPSASGHSSITSASHSSGSSFKKGFAKLSFGKRPKFFSRSNTSKSTLLSPDVSISEDGVFVEEPSIDGDAGISKPWNVQVRSDCSARRSSSL